MRWTVIVRLIRILSEIWAFLTGSPRRKTWTLVVREPFGGKETVREIELTGKSLYSYLGEEWKTTQRALREGKSLGPGWIWHTPQEGERIEIHPQTGIKSFTEAYLKKLNSEHDAGKFLKAAIVTVQRSPEVKRYFVAHEAPIVFAGNTYEPMDQVWQDFEIAEEMQLPAMKVIVPNLTTDVSVVEYLETVDILENDVVLQVLHFDLLGDSSAKDELLLQIQAIEGDDMLVQFTLGLNLGFKDVLPRKKILKSEFPGITSTTIRFAA